MSENKSAFSSGEYDGKIKQTIPYYDEFYKQIMDLVEIFQKSNIRWLDVGCGTGKMGSVVLPKMELEKFIFCDSSAEMLKIAKERHCYPNAEFCVCDILNLAYEDEFDVITAIQVNHYLHRNERKTALQNYYEALKEDGLLICFENFSPFTDAGTAVYLEKWKRYQIRQGKSLDESRKHIDRYGKEYFPITLEEQLQLMQDCGFKTVEILWLSNMQVGIWGMK